MRILALLLLVAVAAGCREKPPEAAPAHGPRLEAGKVIFPPDSPQLQALATEAVVPATPAVARIPGRLVWDEERTARVYPVFAGRVVKIIANLGDAVTAGQTLAQLASPEFGQAQADARKEAAELALAEQNLARARDLVANGVAPKKELNAAEAEYARARAEFTRARDKVKLYGGGETVDSTLALRSPIAGTVVERNINPGQELRPDASAGAPALFVVTDPSRLWLHLDATERELPVLRTGQKVTLHVTAYPDDTFVATIDSIADFVDPQTRTIRVRGSVANPRRKLKGEMYVTADLEGAPRIGFMVPVKAVFLSGSRNFVFVEEARGSYVRTEVRTAGEQEGNVLAIAGVHDGQRVVVDGALFLQQIYQTKGGL